MLYQIYCKKCRKELNENQKYENNNINKLRELLFIILYLIIYFLLK